MSALTAGVKDVRAVIETARRQRRAGGPPTVLFIDEVHRFSKTQQDSLLAAVEDRTVTLLAATTENPYFSVISPLLSRCVLLTLQPLDDDAVRGLLRRAVADERGLDGALTLAAEAEDHLVRLAGGDVRKALTALEAAAASATALGAGRDRPGHRRAGGRRGRACATTGTATRTTTWSARSSRACAARTWTRRCTGWPGCWSPARTPGSSPAAWSSSPARTSAWPTRPR